MRAAARRRDAVVGILPGHAAESDRVPVRGVSRLKESSSCPLRRFRVRSGGADRRTSDSSRLPVGSQTDLDDGIREAQRCLVEALDLDGSTLFELGADGDLLGTHGWWRPELPAPLVRVSVRERFPSMLAKLLAGEVVAVSGIDELPDGVERASLRRFGLKSIAAVPISVGQESSAP